MERFLQLFNDSLAVEIQVTAVTELSKIEDWDSLAVALFIGAVDAEYGVRLEYDVLSGAKTVGDLYDLVMRARQ